MAEEKKEREQNPGEETETSQQELNEEDLDQVAGGIDASSQNRDKTGGNLTREFSDIELKRNTLES